MRRPSRHIRALVNTFTLTSPVKINEKNILFNVGCIFTKGDLQHTWQQFEKCSSLAKRP